LSANALFISIKKQKYTAVITLVNILGLMVSIVPLVLSYGILGAGLSALIGSACAVPFIIYYTRKSFSDLNANIR
jgi:O-antigen/teichoic acid export membrane protein